MISWKKRLKESEVKILEVGWMIWEQLFFAFECPAQYWQTCCCNRLVSQSVTRGDSGHAAWLITETPCHWHTELKNHTHSLIVACTETHKHTAHKKFASSCPQKSKKIQNDFRRVKAGASRERRAAGSESEREVSEDSYLGNRASCDNCLISWWTWWFSWDVCSFYQRISESAIS